MPDKILIVDDEPDIELLVRQRFRKEIRQGDYEFMFACNGTDALEKLDANLDINVVLTDLNMPVMDGLTLLSRIGGLSRIVKVVIVSAYGDMQNIRKAMNLGAFDFLTKPIDFGDFAITLTKTLEHAALLQEAQRSHQRLAAVRQFFSPGLAEQLERAPDLLEGRNQEVTVLVSDLRGFSALAERMGPQEICRLIRDMMERLSNRIVECDGVIVDYAGDGILAMWNAPVAQENHALLACRAALAMQAEMPGLQAEWAEDRWPWVSVLTRVSRRWATRAVRASSSMALTAIRSTLPAGCRTKLNICGRRCWSRRRRVLDCRPTFQRALWDGSSSPALQVQLSFMNYLFSRPLMVGLSIAALGHQITRARWTVDGREANPFSPA